MIRRRAMSDSETSIERFLLRWSRRKRATECGADAASNDRPPVFNPASLPPIESIQAASDVRAFLAPGVPLDLARTALRRAWVIDPTIRDFIGIADNQWDFMKPDEIPGFGPVDLTPDLRRLISALIGDDPQHGSPPQTGSQASHASENRDDIIRSSLDNEADMAAAKPTRQL